MNTHTLSRAFLALILTLLSTWAQAQDLPTRFEPKRDAAKDVATAQAMAAAQGKKVLVDVGGEWCVWCHALDRFIAEQPEVKALIAERYVWVKVNWSPENKNEAVLGQWPKIKGYPHLFVLDAKGQLLHTQDTGELESGKSYDLGRVVAFLKRQG